MGSFGATVQELNRCLEWLLGNHCSTVVIDVSALQLPPLSPFDGTGLLTGRPHPLGVLGIHARKPHSIFNDRPRLPGLGKTYFRGKERPACEGGSWMWRLPPLRSAAAALGEGAETVFGVTLLETFVERDRFRGTVYRAANWQRIEAKP